MPLPGQVQQKPVVLFTGTRPVGPVDEVSLASGRFGSFQGLARDRVVFARYREQGVWSPELIVLLAQALRGGGILIDAGANIGLIAIPVVERSRGRALCFEPEPRNFALLSSNVARHGLRRRIHGAPVALYDRAGPLELGLCADNPGDHRVVDGAGASARPRVQVQARRLDDIVGRRRLPRPVVMKLDTQGAELRVLRGARRTLQQVDMLVVEYWPAGLRRLGDSARHLRAELLRFGYGRVLPQSGPLPPLVPVAQLLDSLAGFADDDEGFFDLQLVMRLGPWSRHVAHRGQS